MGELTAIHVPDEVDESIRDLTRARADAVHDLTRAKQRLDVIGPDSFLSRCWRHSGSRCCGKWNHPLIGGFFAGVADAGTESPEISAQIYLETRGSKPGMTFAFHIARTPDSDRRFMAVTIPADHFKRKAYCYRKDKVMFSPCMRTPVGFLYC
ncbi:MAG: transposase [Spartobacteria bacterium]|nr:transposase [Spartobacteria bacterium]